MAQSLSHILLHLIFSTKDRDPVIPDELKDALIRYIDLQQEHHEKKTFKDEFIAFLHKYKVDYDERYLWS